MLMTPIEDGVWTWRDVYVDRCYSLHDLMDVLEYIEIKNRNEAQHQAWVASLR